jgi:hypothetical protein
MKSLIGSMPSFLVLFCSSLFTMALAQSPSPYTIAGNLRDEEAGYPFAGAEVCALHTDGTIAQPGRWRSGL